MTPLPGYANAKSFLLGDANVVKTIVMTLATPPPQPALSTHSEDGGVRMGVGRASPRIRMGNLSLSEMSPETQFPCTKTVNEPFPPLSLSPPLYTVYFELIVS